MTQKIDPPAQGVYPELSSDVYASWQARSYSYLKATLQSPRHAFHYRNSQPEITAALVFGQHYHVAVLEPKRFKTEHIVAPSFNRRTNKGKADEAEFLRINEKKGREVVSSENFDKVSAMSEALHEQYPELLEGPGARELSGVWKDKETGQTCKLRVDLLTNEWDGNPAVVDLKTCASASAKSIAYDIEKFEYHLQGAFFLDGLHTISPTGRRSLILAQEKKAPYAAGLYEIGEETLDVGRVRYGRALETLAKCEETGHWPGYTDNFAEYIELRPWALNKELGK